MTITSNPILKKLGFGHKDRLVIIHTDDIGMCQASVAAFSDLLEAGLISSGLANPTDRLELTTQTLSNLQPGVTHFIIHPSIDTPELRAITPDWACRVTDYQVFARPAMGDFLKTSDLHVIGYRQLQKLLSSHHN